jgi:hypothetical protein
VIYSFFAFFAGAGYPASFWASRPSKWVALLDRIIEQAWRCNAKDAFGYFLSTDGTKMLYTVHDGSAGHVALANAGSAAAFLATLTEREQGPFGVTSPTPR